MFEKKIIEKKWYVIQVLSGKEERIIKSLNRYISSQPNDIKKFFGKIIIPTENIMEIRNGKKKKSERKFFPGYILIQMSMNITSWSLIYNLPKIIKFIGGSTRNPLPLNNNEIDAIMSRLQQSKKTIKPKQIFEPGELIRIKEGPFIDFHGTVEKIDYEKNRLKISVTIFGRSTPVELNFSQIEKST